MSINKQVARTLTVFMVCICLQAVANCYEYRLIIRTLPPELEVSEVVDNA